MSSFFERHGRRPAGRIRDPGLRHYARITIGAIPGVAPTSLGRVKSIFK